MQRLMSVLLVVAAGCGGDDGANLTDASTSSDASSDAPPGSGLVVQWQASPALPGEVSATVTVTTAAFHVKRLEVLGDAGALAETTRDDYDLVWAGPSEAPPLAFPFAPPAIYSKVRINLDKGPSNVPSLQITGTTTATGSAESFEITSFDKQSIEVTGYNVRLELGQSKELTVLVRLEDTLSHINWATLPVVGGKRVLDDSNMAAMDALFEDLEDAFRNP